jgi:hypothetical protein
VATVTTSPRPADHVDPGGHPPVTTAAEGQGRYLDTRVALALIGIVTFHQLGWHWLPLAVPSMGVLFAVAGSRVAGGFDPGARQLLDGRLRQIASAAAPGMEDLAARRPVRIIPWPRTPRHPNRTSEVAAGSWLARLPLRNRPLLLTCTAIVAAAFVAGALLWPWSEHNTYRAPVGSLGQAVDPHGNGARSPVHSGPPSSQPDQLPATSEGPTGRGPAAPRPTVDPRIPPADRGGLTQQQPPATGSSVSAAPGSAVRSSGPGGSPGSPTATAAPTGAAAQSTAASPPAPTPTVSPTLPVPTSAAPSLPLPSPQVPSGSGLVDTPLPTP